MMTTTTPQPVPLADCREGDIVIYRVAGAEEKYDKWKTVRVTLRHKNRIEVGNGRAFSAAGKAIGGGNQRFRLFDPTPETLASVAACAEAERATRNLRDAEDNRRRVERDGAAADAAAWLASSTAASILAAVSADLLADVWAEIRRSS